MSSPASSELTAQPLQLQSAFNFVFLIEWITVGILTVWFLFYFNRVFATIISYAIRLYSWHSLGIYVDIEAVQISLLAGRIFFKGVHYHGDNETIHIHGGYITWRYWLRRTRTAQIFSRATPAEKHKAPSGGSSDEVLSEPAAEQPDPAVARKRLPCRIEIKVSGVEAFIYNRGPGYDFILDGIEKHKAAQDSKETSRQHSEDEKITRQATSATDGTGSSTRPSAEGAYNEKGTPSTRYDSVRSQSNPVEALAPKKRPTPPAFLRLLPISVECNKAAAVLGNENTSSIITAKIDGAAGEFDAGAAGDWDLFKILMSFDVQRPLVQMKPNMDYKRPQLSEAAILKQTANPTGQIRDPRSKIRRQGLYGPLRLNFGWAKRLGLSKKASASLESVVNLAKLSTVEEKLPDATQDAVPGQSHWLGLTRYLEDEQHDEHDEWQGVEYAKSSTVAELDSVVFKMFWDIPGRRPTEYNDPSSEPAASVRDVNGSEPPEYGMEIIVNGGRVTYGPWADRNRLVLQQIFFPAAFADSHPTPRVKPGEWRLNSAFNLRLRIEGETVLRIPFREPSRDWKWKGRADAVSGKNQATHAQGTPRSRKRNTKQRRPERHGQSTDARPFAWFDIKVFPDSTIDYAMDVYPFPDGFRNKLSLNVKGVEMYSSLNHALLFRSNGVSLSADLPYTLAWNGLRVWTFDISLANLDLFLLRDHTFLLVDLIEDWSTGPPPAFLTFVPYRYILKTHIQNFKMYLNVNDANIVDNSEDLDDNDFVILYGRKIDAQLTIPIDRFRPQQSEIRFDVLALDLGFELSMPPKNTLNALLANKKLAKLPSVVLKGTYGMYTEPRAGLTDTLRMEIIGNGLRVAFYGFFARMLAKIKENYFGETIHFRTNEEFQELMAEPGASPNSTVQNSMNSNDLDVILDIVANDAVIMLPAGLYSCEQFVDLRVERADVDLRVNNYYLELAVDASPLHIGHNEEVKPFHEFEVPKSRPQIIIDGANVSGHRLFGLSPAEPAYVSNWDIDAGDILGDMSCEFLAKIVGAAQAAALTFSDEENGLPLPDPEPIYDVTAVRFQCSLIRLWLRVADVAFLANIGKTAGTFNDINTKHFSQHLNLDVADLHLACTEVNSTANSPKTSRDAHAFFQTAVSLQMLQRSPNFEQNKSLQLEHIGKHDVKGHRAQFLLPDGKESAPLEVSSLCLPKLPPKLQADASTRQWSADNRSALANASLETPLQSPTSVSPTDNHLLKTFGTGSVFDKPSLPLDALHIDLEDVPPMRRSSTTGNSTPRPPPDEIFNGGLDNEAIHTSLLIQTNPGVVLMCKPRAVEAVADILSAMIAKSPVAIFDQYQLSVVQEVIALLTRKRGKRTILDVSLKVPFVHTRIINPFSSGDSQAGAVHGDEYNLTCNDVSTLVRLRNTPEQKRDDGFKAVHLTARSIGVYAQKRVKSTSPVAKTFQTNLDDLFLWVADSDRTSVHAAFRVIETVFSGKDVHYLASLVHRTTLLADSLQAPFTSLATGIDLRRRYLIYRLTSHEDVVADPAFLTRPSYMIRSAKDHLRNSDSWKLVARLRWVLLSLPESELTQLRDDLCREDLSLPDEAEEDVLTVLDQWRSWDAVHVKESIAMRILFNAGVGAAKLQDRSTIPVSLVVQASGLSFTIDHGRKQNDLSLEGIAFALSITPPPPPSAMQIFHEYQEVKMTAVQFNTTRASVNLKWEVSELIDQTLMLFQQQAPGQRGQQSTAQDTIASKSMQDGANREEFHVVFASDTADVNLESLSGSHSFSSDSLKVSATGSHGLNDPEDISVNIISSARASSMKMTRSSGVLWSGSINKPALFIAFESPPSGSESPKAIQVAGDCDELQFDLKEDLLGLLEMVDSLLRAEVKQVMDMVRKYEHVKPLSPVATPAPVETPPLRIRIHLALFLKQYYVRMSVTPSLHYLTEGQTVRMTILPIADSTDKYRADFDLKRQLHHVLSGAVQRPDTTSTLELPPINGTVRVGVPPGKVNIAANVTMETIKLEGSAIYGIVGAFASPSARTAFDSIQGDAQALVTTAKSILPASEASTRPKTPVKQSPDIVFSADFVLAGFAVSATAPSKALDQQPAELIFTVGPTRVEASNRSEIVPALPFPNITVVLGDMYLDIRRGDSQFGRAQLATKFSCRMEHVSGLAFRQNLELSVAGPDVHIDARTAPIVVTILAHFQSLLEGLNLSRDHKYLRRLKHPEGMPLFRNTSSGSSTEGKNAESVPSILVSALKLDVSAVKISYAFSGSIGSQSAVVQEDIVFSIKSMQLLTRSDKEARLKVDSLQVQFAPPGWSPADRAPNSALLPEAIFNVSTSTHPDGRHLTLRAAGKALDLQIDPDIVKPIALLKRSIQSSVAETNLVLGATRTMAPKPAQAVDTPETPALKAEGMALGKGISFVFVSTTFAGAVIKLQGARKQSRDGWSRVQNIQGQNNEGRFGQFLNDSASSSATLKAPGIAIRIRYEDLPNMDSTLNIEVRVDASNNTLMPSVVPLILQISHNVKDTMQESDSLSVTTSPVEARETEQEPSGPQMLTGEDALVQSNPQRVLGRTRLNFGLRICKQEFSLTCQPIAKVAAKAKLDDIYIAVNTVDSQEGDDFFAISVALSGLRASLQHVYSREATFVFDIESIVLSMMNSKHVSGTTGISGILKVNPTKAQLNARQLQDILLFREIWLPPEIRESAAAYQSSGAADPQDYFVNRYRQIAQSAAFPWNGTVMVADLSVEVDLGQAIGKLSSRITDLWASSKKTTSSQQTLCFGIDNISVDSTGRTSGFVQLNKVKVRTSIAWPAEFEGHDTPLIQASIGFHELRLKAAFDYQAFAIAHVTNFEFIMYNIHDVGTDRLVAILDGDKIHVYCVAASAALAVSLTQAIERLVQEKRASYDQSLRDIEKFLRRKSATPVPPSTIGTSQTPVADQESNKGSLPIKLQTDVVVTLRSINVGAFPRTVVDNQLLKLEAVNMEARFAVVLDHGKIHSGLGLTLGQVSAALASSPQQTVSTALADLTVEEVVRNAALARGGVILRVPRVVAAMQTWQGFDSKAIDYTFKSTFEGKIDVGWNYSRISFIRSMWETHTRTLGSRLGRPLPPSALKITAPTKTAADENLQPKPSDETETAEPTQKITAVVNLPQSKYTYRALEPPIIDTPQLRDMGEATPPLEWIGLHRDRLPNVTHQVVIVTLLEVAKEVEDAYSGILGSAKK